MSYETIDFSTLREGERFEAKLARGGLPRSLWETYSAFANTDGGIIVLGLEEAADHTLVPRGVEHPDTLVKEFWDIVNNPKKVSANILTAQDVRIESARDGSGSLVVIDVPRAPRSLRPVFIAGNPLTGTYRRNGEGDYRCPQEDYQAMVRDASPTAGDIELLEGHTLDSLCLDTLHAYRQLLASVRPSHPWLSLDDAEFSLRLGVLGRDARSHDLWVTRAGLLMFGYEYEIAGVYPDYFLDFRTYSDAHDERWSDRVVSNDGEWSGNVFDFWRKVSTRASESLRRPFSLDASALLRVEDTDMHKAVREAVVNALIHADYLGRRHLVIRRYPDRIVCANPGGLRMPVDVALSGGISDTRNPTLMKFFGLINACEKAGSGFDAMRRACEEAGAPGPSLAETHSPDRTELTLWFGGAASSGEDLTRPESQPFLSDEDRVMAYVESQGAAKRVAVQDALGFGSTKTKRLLGKLVEEGRLKVRGRSNQITYLL